MKVLTLLLALLPISSAARADRPATHGMLVLGDGPIYLSHLPMFHSPHDYQLLVEADLSGGALAAYRAHRQQHPGETVYALVPERFSLPEMVAHPRPFRATLFAGHFERGGQSIAENVEVRLVRRLHFRRFDPGAAKPALATYLLFGNEREQFLAHLVTSAPDYDQVLRVKAPVEPGTTAVEVNFPGRSNERALGTPSREEIELPDGSRRALEVVTELYFETGDLAH